MKLLNISLIFLFFFTASFNVSAAGTGGDVKGSKDNHLLKRYEGSTIVYYDKKNYAEFKFLLGPVPLNPVDQEVNARTLEGAYTRLVYLIPEGHSSLELIKNYEEEIKSKNGKILFECKVRECGEGYVGRYIYPLSKIIGGETSKGGCILAPSASTDRHYATMELPDTGTLISVLSYTITQEFHPDCYFAVGHTVAIVDIIEPKAREQKMTSVNAKDMASFISTTGKVTLYGIFFDTNKTDVKAESDLTLEEVTKLLKNNPTLRLLVVGHTDNIGGFSANMELSQRRAAAVTSSLANRYGINKDRLLPVGVSFASPVATNASEEGRAKNRRVELVENISLTH